MLLDPISHLFYRQRVLVRLHVVGFNVENLIVKEYLRPTTYVPPSFNPVQPRLTGLNDGTHFVNRVQPIAAKEALRMLCEAVLLLAVRSACP